jgi:AraC-like DNA-binding protein
MKDFVKYFSVGAEDKDWGLYLTVAGKAHTAPQVEYPPATHPAGYQFHWEHGRILEEFQLNYVTEGGGVLENESGKFPIKAGTLMIIRPGIRHRYRPARKTGWTEHYLGFDGPLARELFGKSIFSAQQSVLHTSIREELLDTYYKIFELAKKEEPGFQQVASGLIIKLMGHLIAFQKQRNFSGKKIEQIIQIARFQMRKNLESKLDLPQFAASQHIGYSYFRKMFKQYTGLSPHQYHLDLKLIRAKELLLTSDKSIKEISFELGFESIYYFSRLFKKKTGTNPSGLRKTMVSAEEGTRL